MYSNIDNPIILEESNKNLAGYDIFSKLLKDRIIFLGQDIDDSVSNVVIAELLVLDSISHDPIKLYINSAGGVVTAGFGIYDTIQHIKSPVHTVCVGQAASMAAVILACGAKGHRYALPHSRVMIHQPSGGAVGACADIQIAAKEINRIKKDLYEALAEHTGKSCKAIEKDCDRDSWMTAADACEYGIIDSVLWERK